MFVLAVVTALFVALASAAPGRPQGAGSQQPQGTGLRQPVPASRAPVQAPPSQAPAPVLASQADASVRAVLDRYCVQCHSERLRTGGLTLQTIDTTNVPAGAEVWEKVIRKLRTDSMPPPGLPRPDAARANAVASWLEGEIDRDAAARPHPGRTEALHRLNRVEYQNAVRDLLALDIDAAALVPADDQSYGFDNIAGVLKMSPTLLERYLGAAHEISRLAVGTSPILPTAETFRLRSELAQ
jgi:mono/diheme cytochrome c family protein